MKKYKVILVMICVLVLSMTYRADASLQRVEVPGEYVIIVDEDNGLMWADLTLFLEQSYDEQQATIVDLNAELYAGSSDWSMSVLYPWHETYANQPEDVDAAFTPTLVDINTLWSGRINTVPAELLHGYVTLCREPSRYIVTQGHIMDGLSHEALAAWVSAPYVAPQQAPEPVTIFLFVTGLICLAGFRRKFQG